MRIVLLSLPLFALWLPLTHAEEPAAKGAVVLTEFVYTEAPFPECHASTLAQASDGTLVAAWFGGTYEKHPDVGIWVSRRGKEGWSKPVEVANGVESDTKRYPTWNPVLFQPRKGPLLLYYKVGPSPSTWWGMRTASNDAGKTWTKPVRLPDGFLGPIKNKPIQLADDTILCPTSSEHAGWRVHFERTNVAGTFWEKTEAINDGKTISAIQPSLLRHSDGSLQALGRSRQGRLWSSRSSDNGKTWSEMTLLDVPNPSSGTDAVTLADGRHLLVYNPTRLGRTPLSVALSRDGKDWKSVLVLENQQGEYSYPAVIQTPDGRVHISYTWKRKRIKYVVIDPSKLAG